MIRRIVGIHFSPIGGTARMTDRLTAQLADLLKDCCPDDIRVESYELMRMGPETVDLDDETVAVIGMPVYVGKVPLPAISALRKFRPNGAAAVTAVSFGSRTFGNALYELQHFTEDQGFKVLGAGAFAVSYRKGGIGREMSEHYGDVASLTEFGTAAAAKIRRLAGTEIEELRIRPVPLEVAGRLPIHRISRLSPRAAAAAQELLERICIRRSNSEWYL